MRTSWPISGRRCAPRPTPCPLADAETHARVALVERRRRPVVARRTAEENRLGATRVALVRARIQADPGGSRRICMQWLATDLREIDRDLRPRLRASPLGRDQDDRLRRALGIGPIVASR